VIQWIKGKVVVFFLKDLKVIVRWFWKWTLWNFV